MLKTVPVHSFSYRPIGYLKNLFDDCNTMDELMRNIERLAKSWSLNDEKRRKFKGDAFEFFVELFFMFHPNDSQLGLANYEPIPSKHDYGTDALATSIRTGERCAIQVKYRLDVKTSLFKNKDKLANLVQDAHQNWGVNEPTPDDKDKYRFFVVTTSPSVTSHNFNVCCFGISALRQKVDGNSCFWDRCRIVVEEIEKEREAKLEAKMQNQGGTK